MPDEQQLIVKIPNPIAGPAHYTTASEVTIMQFVRNPFNLYLIHHVEAATQAIP